MIPVAVLGSTDFDATQVDSSTVTFGPHEASPLHDGLARDINNDGFVDMLFHFATRASGIRCDDASASFSGKHSHNRRFPALIRSSRRRAGRARTRRRTGADKKSAAMPGRIVIHVRCENCGHSAKLEESSLRGKAAPEAKSLLRCRECGRRRAGVQLVWEQGPVPRNVVKFRKPK
jgi:hypothetical protein